MTDTKHSRGNRREGDFTRPVSFRLRVADWNIIERLATDAGLSVGQFASEQLHQIALRADRPARKKAVAVEKKQQWAEADARRLGERECSHDYRAVPKMPGVKRCTACGDMQT